VATVTPRQMQVAKKLLVVNFLLLKPNHSETAS
jgi:hypothetical protein